MSSSQISGCSRGPPETPKMGPRGRGGWGGRGPIGGAKSIRLDERCRRDDRRTSGKCARYGLWKAHRVVPGCTMIDWDDVRYFLAVARGGSVRAAAERLGFNHSTVLRRIAQLEEHLG